MIVSLCLGLALMGPVSVASARSPDDVTVTGVSREAQLSVKVPAGAAKPRATLLPGHRALDVVLPLPEPEADKIVSALPDELKVETRPVEGGTRVRIVHAERELRFAEGHGKAKYVLAVGPESEETRLRRLADRVQRPIVTPNNLGAHLELWEEAERATSEGELELAKRLWDKLAEAPELADLAKLRVAELYVISGHVNEALERLRFVSRHYPRTSGAALARLTALNLQAIIGEADATPPAVIIAASAGNRQRFRPFAWLRATQVLTELEASELALDNFPRMEQLPEEWREVAKQERDRVVASAIGIPATSGEPFAAVVQFRAWSAELEDHPEYDAIARVVAESYLELGLHAPAIPLLRRQLSAFPDASAEAEVLTQLAESYHAIGDLEHEIEVVRFMVAQHPSAPGTARAVRDVTLHTWTERGLDGARTLAANLRRSTRRDEVQRAAFAAEIELLAAEGTPAQLVQVLESMRAIGFDDPELREPQLAMALARDGRAAQAEPKLRDWINRSTDPERRDEMAYLLANAEIALGRDRDADRILEALGQHATDWGRVARARLRERALERLVSGLEATNDKLSKEEAH